ncbi:VCBS repeat-containing protein [Gaetbulibacter sp. M240]|uniref:VCBS repeat-containing protein n=1 Tax=Gaetbulibacter sp. M240 TaxID=3126511 RepID=UPI00374E9B00
MDVKNIIIVLLIAGLAVGCAKNDAENKLFERIGADYSGINFENKITTNDSINILKYEYLYNGGGVGVGDFNNDNLPDIVLSGNMVKSRVYINSGDFTFEDITESSGFNTEGKWCAGVSIIDINQDGYDDIYINRGGMGNQSKFPNLLYINNGDLTFTESAEAYGVADKGESIQALFFDYDRDGDLDMYLLTGGGFEKSAIRIRPILKEGESRNTDHLYRNDFNEELGHPVFTDVSREAGINLEGFGLGVSVFDSNNDNWPDLYISNDYLSRDYLYINQQDGTFKEGSEEYFGHTSHFSMGNDVADINNDGLMDLITVDMLPEDVKRRKLMSGEHSQDIFNIELQFGYGHQYMRNMLHVNNGNKTFSEIGLLSGIDKTDWSWAPLMADFDNDGLNDIYVTNGFGKDITDMDFVKYRESKATAFKTVEELQKSLIDCLYYRPTIKVPNYAYKNNGDLTFQKETEAWGFNEPSLSNGAAYADLDNDGDLDLVVNNIDQPPFVYKNNLREKDSLHSNYIKVALEGPAQNKKGIGAKVTIFYGSSQNTRYNQPVRGFQSSVGTKLHFGLKDKAEVDSLKVMWPDGKINKLSNVKPNQVITLAYSNASYGSNSKNESIEHHYFTQDSLVDFFHKENNYNDFAVQALLLNKYSNLGPGMAVGDLNGDGLDDVFVGGSYGFNSLVFYQNTNGKFDKKELPDSAIYEDMGALIFDADGDGKNDLYLASGGSERYAGHKAYQDRIYFNRNNELTQGILPEMRTSTSAVVGGDFDNDGDIDLFVGGRLVPGKYPTAPRSYILENQEGKFKDVTARVCPFLEHAGMVTSAIWSDVDNDSYLDLLVVGEFMPITILKGDGKLLKNLTKSSGLANTSGLWNSIQSGDFDNDGDIDFVAGNLGENSILKVVDGHPVRLDYADFDNNGSVDPIFSKYENNGYYPVATLDQLINQLPLIKKKFLFYNTFAKSNTDAILDLFDANERKTLKAGELRTSYIENLGDGNFVATPLPIETQIAPVHGILPYDVDKDGYLDLLLVGNNYGTEVAVGRYDASIGHVLKNSDGKSFVAMNNKETGFSIIGDARSLVKIDSPEKSMILVGMNNATTSRLIIDTKKSPLVSPKSEEIFARIKLKNGQIRKHEWALGGGYLSQSSTGIEITENMESVTFYNRFHKITRKIEFN